MCNRLKINVKGVSRYTPKGAFVPCGKCAECRESQRSGWTFRLRAEFESLAKKNWWFAFVTLTYNDNYLPHLPFSLLKTSAFEAGVCNDGRTPMCFNKNHVRNFITSMRQWLFRRYGAVRKVDPKTKKLIKDDHIRYLVGSEFGDHTRRSHYHMILALPSYVPPQTVHTWIKQNWIFGFIFPKDFYGGMDAKGYNHSPFVVDSVGCATAYASKYVCKDIGFMETFNPNDWRKEMEFSELDKIRLSDYMPFHMQSKSLGACFLDGLTDREKIEKLTNGHWFVGEKAARHLPVYLRNKLIYNNVYIYDKNGKRLCTREANDFFKRYYREIYDKKVEFVEQEVKEIYGFVSRILNYIPESVRSLYEKCYRDVGNDFKAIARIYLSCGHVNRALCYDIDPAKLWLSRYMCERDSEGVYDVDLSDARLLPSELVDSVESFFDCGVWVLNELRKPIDLRELEEERKIDKLRQFFKE